MGTPLYNDVSVRAGSAFKSASYLALGVTKQQSVGVYINVLKSELRGKVPTVLALALIGENGPFERSFRAEVFGQKSTGHAKYMLVDDVAVVATRVRGVFQMFFPSEPLENLRYEEVEKVARLPSMQNLFSQQ